MRHVSLSTTAAIELTPAALKRIVVCLEKKPDCRALRLSVKKTGCSGLSYVMDYVSAPEAHDVLIPLEQDYILCVDKSSYPFLKGMQIDFVRQGLNEKFVFNNPNQTGQCGCGESFTVT